MDKSEANNPAEPLDGAPEEIGESIRRNIVQSCQEGTMSCPDCDGSGKCQQVNGEG